MKMHKYIKTGNGYYNFEEISSNVCYWISHDKINIPCWIRRVWVLRFLDYQISVVSCAITSVSKHPVRHRMHTLQWRHNERDGVSNHRCLDCLLNRLLRRRSKKTSKLRVTGLCEGNPPVTCGFPHKGSMTRKMFPFDDAIMDMLLVEGHKLNCDR